jgi:hypothetical protein
MALSGGRRALGGNSPRGRRFCLGVGLPRGPGATGDPKGHLPVEILGAAVISGADDEARVRDAEGTGGQEGEGGDHFAAHFRHIAMCPASAISESM